MSDSDADGETPPEPAEEPNAAPEESGTECNTETATTETDTEEARMDCDPELLEEVREMDAEALTREIKSLRERAESAEADRESLESEVSELEDRIKRVQADFQNYKRRTEDRAERAADRAKRDLVGQLLPVRDNLARALDQDEDTDIRDGVQATLREFDEVLEDAGVEAIEPSVGEAVDPDRHEVVHREDDDGDAIASVYRTGYELEDTVIRPAQVTVGSVSADADTEAEDA